MWWGVEETFADLFAHLECAPNFDGNPEGMLHVALGDVGYNPVMTPALIRLHGAYYMVLFHPGECNGYSFDLICIASEFAFAAGVDYNARENYNMSLDNGSMLATSGRMSTIRASGRRLICGPRVVE